MSDRAGDEQATPQFEEPAYDGCWCHGCEGEQEARVISTDSQHSPAVCLPHARSLLDGSWERYVEVR
jgi:hypothetical protein